MPKLCSPLLRIQIDGRKVGLNVHESIIQFIREGIGEGRGGGGGGGLGDGSGGGSGGRIDMSCSSQELRSFLIAAHLNAGVILVVTV